MPKILVQPETYIGKKVFKNTKGDTQCVEFIRQTLSAPATSLWREGLKIRRLAVGERDPVACGTAIATFVGGRYPQEGDTGKHAAIYLGQDGTGLQVVDQWKKQGEVGKRTIYWEPTRPGLSNDGHAFSIIEW
jgi:hypothetical protein